MLLQVREPADAVRHADAPQPVNPRIGVGREPRVVFARHPDQLDRALLDQLVKLEDVVAGDAEDVLDAQGPQPVDQVLADGRRRPRPAQLADPWPTSTGLFSRVGTLDRDACHGGLLERRGFVNSAVLRPGAPSIQGADRTGWQRARVHVYPDDLIVSRRCLGAAIEP